jgi:hypothetical protein
MKKVFKVLRKIDDSWVGDLLGCVFVFALIPSVWFLLYGFGW